MNDNIKDKAVFIIGLLAIFLTLTTFKDNLSKITVPLGSQTFTIWNLTVFLISALMISVYLFALSYIQHSFGTYKDRAVIKWAFRIIIFLANFFYSVALIFPLLAVLGSLFATSPLGIFGKTHAFGLGIFDAVGTLVLTLAGIINAFFLSKKSDSKL